MKEKKRKQNKTQLEIQTSVGTKESIPVDIMFNQFL
jgi:hypothetical protein